jgi:glycosyltransferase involved in cell wall biosynthesis
MKEKKQSDQKNPEQFLVFAATLFIDHGGVLDYTDNLALQLQAVGKLKAAIAPEARKINRPYKIEEFSIYAKRKYSRFDKFPPLSKLVTLFYFLRLYREIFFEMKRLAGKYPGTTIVFTEYYSEQFDIIVACARWQKVPYAIVFHGLDFICARQKAFNHFTKNYNKARFIIYNSEATIQLGRRLFNVSHKQELLLHPGLNVPAIEKNYPGIVNGVITSAENKKRIVFSTISRLVKRKGIDLAIRMVAELKNQHKDIEIIYYIAGVGVETDSLKQLIQQLKAQSYVKMLGNVSEEEKYKLLQQSDFFLMPNHSVDDLDFEGFGISFIEASLFGNVVIGGTHGGVKEAVMNEHTGYLFDFDKKESIRQAVLIIDNCIRKPVLMENIKRQGIDFVRKNYDWNNLIKKFLEFRN